MTTIMPRKAAEFWWNLHREDKDKIIIPPEVAYFTKEHFGGKWKITTWKEEFKARTLRQERRLSFKRFRDNERIKYCYIWVFYNESWLYGGWWIYLKTLKEDYPLNFRNDDRTLMVKAMKLFPCGIIPMRENFYQWAEQFAKEYHSNSFGRKIQGLKMCKCEIDNCGRLKNIM